MTGNLYLLNALLRQITNVSYISNKLVLDNIIITRNSLLRQISSDIDLKNLLTTEISGDMRTKNMILSYDPIEGTLTTRNIIEGDGIGIKYESFVFSPTHFG